MLGHAARVALLLSVLLMCLPGTAGATSVAKIKIEFVPNKPGAQISIRTIIEFSNTNGGLPSPVIGFDLRMPSQLELITSTLGLAICQPKPLLENGLSGCSPNARLGFGSATVAVPFGPEVVSETASIQALMGPPVEEQIGVLLFAESRTPVFAQLMYPGKLLIGETGPERLNTTFPPTPTLPGAPDATVTHMELTVGPNHLTYYKLVHGKRVGFRPSGVTLPPHCPRAGFRFVTDMRFEDGSTLEVPYTVPCPPRSHGARRGGA